jgi:hypothetical protein
VAGAVIALVAAVAIKEIPLRTSNEEPVPTGVPLPARPVPTPDGTAAAVSRPDRPPA